MSSVSIKTDCFPASCCKVKSTFYLVSDQAGPDTILGLVRKNWNELDIKFRKTY